MWKRIAKMQLVGDGQGFACFRDIYEKDGDYRCRVSAITTEYFYMQDQRKLGENYPPHDVMFARFALPESKIVWEPLSKWKQAE
jgi:hypothetical protein